MGVVQEFEATAQRQQHRVDSAAYFGVIDTQHEMADLSGAGAPGRREFVAADLDDFDSRGAWHGRELARAGLVVSKVK